MMSQKGKKHNFKELLKLRQKVLNNKGYIPFQILTIYTNFHTFFF